MSDANALKVALCEALVAINREGVDRYPRDGGQYGPIIPPTAINWIGDRLVTAVLNMEASDD